MVATGVTVVVVFAMDRLSFVLGVIVAAIVLGGAYLTFHKGRET